MIASKWFRRLGRSAPEDGMRAGRMTTVFRRALDSVTHWVERVSASGGPVKGTLAGLSPLLLLAGWTPEARAQSVDGVTVSPASLALTELGSSSTVEKTYTVVLDTDPTADVTITVANNDATAVSVDTDTGTTGNQTTLTFTAGGDGSGSGTGNGNWATAQTVTVRALNDADALAESFDLTHSATATGSTAPYHGITIDPVAVTTTDAGHGVVVSKSSLSVAESDETATYTVALKSQPGGTVAISATSGATTTATVSPATLSFTSSDWNTPKTFTVTGKGEGSASISHAVQSSGDTTNYPTTTTISGVSVTVTADSRQVLDVVVTPGNPTHVTESSQSRFDVVATGASSTQLTLISGTDGSFRRGGLLSFTGEGITAGDYEGPGRVDFFWLWPGSPPKTRGGTRIYFRNDDIDEPNETLVVGLRQRNLSSEYRAGKTTSFTITDNDPTTVTLGGGGTVPEGGSGSSSDSADVTVTLGRNLVAGETVTVPLAITGTGIAGSDYTIAPAPGSSLNTGVTLNTNSPHSASQPAVVFTGHDTNTVQVATLRVTAVQDTTYEGASEALTVGFGSGNRAVTSNLDRTDPSTTGTEGTTTEGTATVIIESLPVITISGGVAVTEETGASFTVNANPAPAANLDVTVAVTQSGDFVASSNRGAKTVTIDANATSKVYTVPTENDMVKEANGSVTVTVNSGEDYTVGSRAAATVTVEDNDTAAVTIVESHGATSVSEAAGASRTDSYTVALATRPTHDVTITPTSSDTGAATVSGTLTFTPSNWSTPQTVTVTGVDENVDNPGGSRDVSISHAASSTDPNYAIGSAGNVEVTVTDDDATTVTLAAAAGDIQEGQTKEFTITLNRGLVDGEILTAPLTFTGTATRLTDYTMTSAASTGVQYNNLNSGTATVVFTGPQSGATATTATITLSATSDSVEETTPETVDIGIGTITNTGLTGAGGVSETDSLSEFNISDAGLGAGVKVSINSLALIELGAANVVEKTYTVVLNTDPTADVTITVANGDDTAVEVDTDTGTTGNQNTLTFTAGGNGSGSGTGNGNWAVAQAVTVRALNDVDAVNESFSITHSATATGSTAPYHGITIDPVAVTTTDAGHGVVVSKSSLSVAESDETATYTVALKSQPGGTVAISATSGATTTATVSPATLSFTSSDWNTPKTFTVTGKGEGSASISHAVQSSGDTTNYPTTTTIDRVSVTVTADSRQVLDLAFASGSPTHVTEGNTNVKVDVIATGAVSGLIQITPRGGTPFRGPKAGLLSFTGEGITTGDYERSRVDVIWLWPSSPPKTNGGIGIVVSDDDIDEPNETLVVGLQNLPSGYRAGETVEIMITDQDPTTVTLAGGGTVAEDGSDSADVTVTLGRNLVAGETVTVPLAITGTGIAGSDYTIAPAPGSSLNTGVTLNTNSPHSASQPAVVFTGHDTNTVQVATLRVTAVQDTTYEGASEALTVGFGSGNRAVMSNLDRMDPSTTGTGGTTPVGTATVTITDDDIAGVTVSPASLALTELGSPTTVEKTYTVVLNTDPTVDVTITVTNGDATAVSVDTDTGTTGNQTTLTFTAGGDGSGSGTGNGNWATAQTVTVRALNDADALAESFDLTHSATATGSTAPYHGITIDPVAVTTTDAGHGVVVSKSSLSVAESDETATYTVALKSQPGGTVAISATSGATTTATVSPATLSFTSSDWNTPKTFTVTGKGEGSASISHAVQSSGDTTNYPTTTTIDRVSVTVTADSRQVLDMAFASGSPTHVTEGNTNVMLEVIATGASSDKNVIISPPDGSPLSGPKSGLLGFTGEGITTGDYFRPRVDYFWLRKGSPPKTNSGTALRVTVSDDDIDEPNETLVVGLQNLPSGYRAGETVEIMITDQDPTTVTLAGGGTVAEDGSDSADVTVTLGRNLVAGETVTVPLAITGTGIAGSDYTIAPAPGSSLNTGVTLNTNSPHSASQPAVVFTGHDTNTVQVATLRVTAVQDTTYEGASEALTVGFGSGNRAVMSNLDRMDPSTTGTGGTTPVGTATVTITDDDTSSLPVLSTELPSVEGLSRNTAGQLVFQEANTEASFNVSLAPSLSADFTACIRVTETGGDRVAAANEGVKVVTVPSTGTLGHTITWTDTAADDRDSVVTVEAVAPNTVGCSAASGTYTVSSTDASDTALILDDDPTTVELTSSDTQMREGDASNTATLTFRLGRQLHGGEVVVVPFTLTTTTGARLPGNATPDFTVSATGTEVSITGANTATPRLTFTGHETNTVQTATVTLTPVANRNDGDTAREEITATLAPDSVLGSTSGTGTTVGGGAIRHGTNYAVDLTLEEPLPVITISGGVAVTEGTGASFTVNANPPPAANLDVTVAVTQSGDFVTSSNRGAKTVTIAANATSKAYTVATENDMVDEADGSVTVTVNSGQGYTVGSTAAATVMVNDDDTAAVTIVESGGSTSVSEAAGAGRTDSYTVALATQPTHSVTITPTSSNTAAATVSSALTFTTSNWSAPQTVTVTGVDDNVDNPGGGRDVSISHAASSTDPNYRSAGSVEATVTDDDATTVTLAAAAGDIQEGQTKEFTITLGRGLVDGEVLTAPLTFTGTATRGTDYTMTGLVATGVQYNNLDSGNATVVFTGPQSGATATTATITLSATSDSVTETTPETVDIAFGTITNTGLTSAGGVSETDSLAEFNISDAGPGAGVTVSTNSLALTELGAANLVEKTYTIVLDTDPVADVTITVTNGDSTAVEVDTNSRTGGNQNTLTFTAGGDGSGSGAGNGNWAVPQTVTMRALNDVDSANESFNITHAATAASGPYDGITVAPVAVTITDAGHGVVVSESSLSVAENDEEATYTVVLKSQPGGPVTISATSDATTTAEVSPASLSFTNSDWNTPKTFTVTGKDMGSTSIRHEVTTATTAYPTSTTIDGVTVTVTVDPRQLLDLSTLSSPANEGTAATLRITATGATADQTVAGGTALLTFSGEGIASSDYSVAAQNSFSLTGGPPPAGTATVNLAADNADEPNEALVIGWQNLPSGYRAGTTAMVTIIDQNPTMVTLAGSGTAMEDGNDSADVTVTLSRNLVAGETVTVPLAITGTGITAGDYTIVRAPGSSLNRGVTLNTSNPHSAAQPAVVFTGHGTNTVQVATLRVTAVQDTTDEGASEALTVGFGSGNRAVTSNLDRVSGTGPGGTTTAGTATVTITDDETADTTAPRVTSIIRQTPSSSPTDADSLTWRVTFNEAVQNVDATDFQVSGTTAILAAAQVDATNAYDVTASGGDLANLDATVTLSFVSGQDIEDTSGNSLSNTTPTGANNNNFVVDNSGEGSGDDTLSVVSIAAVHTLPVVSVTAGEPVSEGEGAIFTLTATPAPATGNPIIVNLMLSARGEVISSGETGNRSVTIDDSGTATVTVSTEDDAVQEEDGSVTATVQDGTGYTIHASNSSASVTVRDNELAELSVPSLTVAAGESASYAVTLADQPMGEVTVTIAVTPEQVISLGRSASNTVENAMGLVVTPSRRLFTRSNWNVPQEVVVRVAEDAHDASLVLRHIISGGGLNGGDTHLPVTVEAATETTEAVEAATETVEAATEAAQGMEAWRLRFVRTVSQQVAGALQDRFAAPTTTGLELTVAGEAISSPPALAENDRVLSKALGFENLTGEELLEGSSFSFAPQGEAGAPQLAFWGQGAFSSFSGQEEELSLDGDVTTLLLGADWSTGRWQAGAALSRSWGSGSYDGDDNAEGEISTSLTGLFPYGRYALTPRLGLWATAGYGWGDLSLKPDGNGEEYEPDTTMTMVALGMDGLLLDGGSEGVSLNATADLLSLNTTSEKVEGLESSEGNLSRLRLGLEATRPFPLANGSSLLPSLEVGIRQDGGDAETGFGMDLGAGIAWKDPEQGINGELKGRTLLNHAEEDFQDQGLALSFSWDPSPSNRGPSLSMGHAMGLSTEEGIDALLNPTVLDGLDASPSSGQRFEAELAYGFPFYNNRLTLTPAVAIALSPTSRTYGLLWSVTPYDGQSHALSWELSIEAERQEQNTATSPVEHSLKLNFSSSL